MNSIDPDEGSGFKNWLERLVETFQNAPKNRSDLLKIFRSSAKRGLIETEIANIVEGAITFSTIHARDIMIPRGRCTFLNISDHQEEVLEVVVDSGHSRFPVLGDSVDDVKGVLHARDLISLLQYPAAEKDWQDCIRKAVVIPGNKPLYALLEEFRITRNHMAVIIDEYSHIEGLVTIEDVLEQIVGDIVDEHDKDDHDTDNLIKTRDRVNYDISALISIDEFNQYFKTDLTHDEYETIGGMIIYNLGHLPTVGEKVTLGHMIFEVKEADERRIHLLALHFIQQDIPGTGTDDVDLLF